MQVRGNFRRKNVDAGFALSDHADWKGLLSAIEATGAQKVFVTHGFQAALSRYLNERGIEAAEVKTEFGEEEMPRRSRGMRRPAWTGGSARRRRATKRKWRMATRYIDDAPFRRFTSLVILLGTSTGTNDKLDALADYFSTADDKDKVWVIALFSGRKPKRAVNSTQLYTWCTELTGLPQWLFEESYHTVGDLAETIALLLPDPSTSTVSEEPLSYYLEKLMQIGKEEEPVKKKFILDCWEKMDQDERFVFNKLITGGFRIGVSQKLMVNALARTVSTEPAVIAHRISGNWDPAAISFGDLLSAEVAGSDVSRPYPFYLAYALDVDPATLGNPEDWQAEWKWDGIRGQLIKRGDQFFVWSRGEELMTEKFPEYQAFSLLLPDGVVIDGEIIGLANSTCRRKWQATSTGRREPLFRRCHSRHCRRVSAERTWVKNI